MNRGTRFKLVRVLGMLGSEHPGERASAALAAHRMVSALGMTWDDVIAATPAGASKTIVKRIHEYGIEHHRAAEARMRQLKTTCQSLEAENKSLRRRIATMAEQARKASLTGP
ncbi:MAG: hypothetical protein ACOH2N_12730 [Devosia sp.]